MSVFFALSDISKSYGDDTLFSDLNIDFKAGEQLGLIGNNGSGKSTLLKLIAGEALPDTGVISVQKNCRIVYLSQEDRLNPEHTVETVLFDCLAQLPMDDKEKHRRVNQALGKGGFVDTTVQVKNLSGGWKKRLAITRSLCMDPNLLLLDEPTNHLDIHGILWLEQILKSALFSFIVVSHDRAFLENTCAGTLEIAKYYPKGYFKFQGGYRMFEQERNKFLAAQEKQQASMASKMRREDEWLRQGAKARSTKAKFRIDQAENLRQALEALRERNRHTARVDMDFTGTGRQTRKLIQVHNLTKGYGQQPLFSGITFEMGPGFCLGVVGVNGSGKSTFLSLLEKKLSPDQGTVKWADGLKIAVFDQNRTRLDPDSLLREALNPAGGDSVHYQEKSVHVVTWAKRFLFMPDQLDMPVGRLSGGEKARIVLANLMLQPADVLLLDEPTNDLDILSLEVLEQRIKEFPGAVVIVSHDRYLMDRVCHRMLFLDPDSPPDFYKNFSQIFSAVTRKSPGTEKTAPASGPEAKSGPASASKPVSETRTGPGSGLVFSFKDKYELEHMEDTILEAEARVTDLSARVQDPEVMADPVQMANICRDLEKAEARVQALYTRWDELEQKKADAGK
ncbi:ABC-F family ATP-binding cassette domain-containing protein [Desulfotignum phosphitoxidans]|uniref:ABC transporter ATP-binding protein n=1 Tax=Desulfotignum phosphitoxidans DSM 13687 TaxID=1286635 RepID=S0FW66_9BACT|nr:ABC-F family ATP-binding cassette domain-containing protein [Desulfotignum phosphitoxidans]EMS79298.1 ABC transporter ATP-binding protein [Desulfotignum phosphitoxidans DSM 13687]